MMINLLYGAASPQSTMRVSLVPIYVRKNAPVSARVNESTFPWMGGNTPDLKIHLWFSFWNIAIMSGARSISLPLLNLQNKYFASK